MRMRDRLLPIFTAISIVLVSIQTPSALAASHKLTLLVSQKPNASESTVTLYGSLKPFRSKVIVKIQINTAGSWKSTIFSAKTSRTGTFKVVALGTALKSEVKYRATALVLNKRIYSNVQTVTIQQLPEISQTDTQTIIEALGPGSRIHGADISRWQHPNEKPIDFVKMYGAGIRFVMIKASDTRDITDATTLKYLKMDLAPAQAAGIITGFYHYAILPDVTDSPSIIKDAQAQAQKVIWRLASLGGYNEKELPYALDLEDNCVRLSANGSCAKYASRNAITLWASTFLAMVRDKTGRTPFLYSYSSFLENAMTRSPDLAQYPLWLAQYALDPADPLAQPGLKNGGCYVHSWTTSGCATTWTIWQYTSCGIAPKYGVPGTRLDLNVFRGSPNIFSNLTKGSWIPDVIDLMPTNEPTQMSVDSITATNTNKPVIFNVSVNRPNLNPVVTGTVKLVLDPAAPVLPKPTQSAVRSTSGVWTLAVKGIPAGVFQGLITYIDISNTHATTSIPVTFTVTQGVAPTPTPTPDKPTPAPTKKPVVDSCAKQIRN